MLYIAPALFVLALGLLVLGQAVARQQARVWLLGAGATLVLLVGLYQSAVINLPEIGLALILGTVVGRRLAGRNEPTPRAVAALPGIGVLLTALALQWQLEVERMVYLTWNENYQLWLGLGMAAAVAASPFGKPRRILSLSCALLAAGCLLASDIVNGLVLPYMLLMMLAGYNGRDRVRTWRYYLLLGVALALVSYVAAYPLGCGIGIFIACQGANTTSDESIVS